MSKSFLLILVFFFCQTSGLWSKHIIGGEIFYKLISRNTSRNSVTVTFTMNIYRDCAAIDGAPFDNPAKVGFYFKNSNNSFTFESSSNWRLKSDSLVRSNNPCVVQPPSICVRKGEYEITRELYLIGKTYFLAYQRCCRNITITNILTPGDFGAAYTLEITPEALVNDNSSPTFKSFPPIIICNNQSIDFDHSAIDQDGDQIIYEFCNPFHAGGKNGSGGFPGNIDDCNGVTPNPEYCLPPFSFVRFRSPQYSFDRPMGGNPIISINPVTGLITGVPQFEGQYVVGVCMKEYRNGVLLSVVQRDFQFNVINCVKQLNASITSDSIQAGDKYIVNACGDNTVNLINTSTIESNIRAYEWEFNINGQKKIFTDKNPSLTLPGLGRYSGYLFLNKGDGICSDTSEIVINVYPGINANYNYNYDTCVAGPIQFTDLSNAVQSSITKWKYSFEPNQESLFPNSNYEFKTPGIKDVKLLITDNNGCKDSITKAINYYPVPALIVLNPNIFKGCEPLDVFFENLSYPIDSTYDIEWDLGDGEKSKAISPKHTYTDEGIYFVNLIITSPIGCKTSASFPSWINVAKSPIANFDYNPTKLSNYNRQINLKDKSIDSETHIYIIDDKITTLDRNYTYVFADTGVHKLEQIVARLNGCSDTLIQYIDVEPIINYFVPNAFTPNGNGSNEVFFGVGGYWEWMQDFKFSIWDRWGGKIFESSDPNKAWNGLYDNTGYEVQPGVYVYLVEYLAPRDKRVKLKGFVNLIR